MRNVKDETRFCLIMLAAMFLWAARAFAGDDLSAISRSDAWGTLVEILAPILTALAGWLTWRFQQWVATKTKNESVRHVASYLSDLVEIAVKAAEQTTVKAIRTKNGGTLSVEEGKAIANETLLAVKGHLGQTGADELCKILRLQPEAVDKLIAAKIEAAVLEAKQK
jgi:hypothetical protein